MSIHTIFRDVRGRLGGLKFFQLATVLTTLLLTACNHDDPAPAPAPFLMGLGMIPSGDQTLEVGQSRSLNVYGTYSAGAAAQNVNATWTSSAPAIARVSSGLVTAVAVGTTTIQATFEGKSATVNVTVTAATPTISSISVTPSSPSIAIGATQQFTATGTLSNNTTRNITSEVTWTSSATAVASVSNDEASRGLASALSVGTANITATLGTVTSPAAVLTVTSPAPAAVLSASMTGLTLSVQDPGLNAALIGTARTLQITNTSAEAATALNLTSQNFPAGTTFSSTCGTTLAPSATCEIEVAPGSTPSAAPGVTSASAATLTVAGSNTNTLSLAVNVLTYGSVFQGGYVFSIDDTTPATESIAGRVVGLTDRSAGVKWSATSDEIYGINEYSTPGGPSPSSGQLPGMSACNGGRDGACNSTNIKVQYAASNPADYAAGVCTSTSDGYSDWYLPAICQLGYDTSHTNYACGYPTPVIQNIQSSLVNNGGIGSLSGQYWSSTQLVSMPAGERAWAHAFAASPIQSQTAKSTSIAVRCVRDLTE